MTEEQALRRLAAMCSKAEHSSGEVDAKMRSWQMDDGARTRVAERLRSAGYVDDARFCRSFEKNGTRDSPRSAGKSACPS